MQVAVPTSPKTPMKYTRTNVLRNEAVSGTVNPSLPRMVSAAVARSSPRPRRSLRMLRCQSVRGGHRDRCWEASQHSFTGHPPIPSSPPVAIIHRRRNRDDGTQGRTSTLLVVGKARRRRRIQTRISPSNRGVLLQLPHPCSPLSRVRSSRRAQEDHPSGRRKLFR